MKHDLAQVVPSDRNHWRPQQQVSSVPLPVRLERVAPKRRRIDVGPVWVAVPSPGGLATRWLIVGWCNFLRADSFVAPASDEIKMIEQMTRKKIHEGGSQKYRFPFAAVVGLAGWLQHCVEIDLPQKTKCCECNK